MGKLDGFHKDAADQSPRPGRDRPQPPAPVPARKAPFDRDRCPAGYDEGIWDLALRFEQYARADRIELRAGRPIIYAEINALVTRWHLREKSFIQVSTGCKRRLLAEDRADHCWYHTEDAADRAITWVEMVLVIMAEFWSRIQDAHALDYFRQYFAEYGQAAVLHWRSLDMIAKIEARPKPPRAIVRRRIPGATMAGADKEGE